MEKLGVLCIRSVLYLLFFVALAFVLREVANRVTVSVGFGLMALFTWCFMMELVSSLGVTAFQIKSHIDSTGLSGIPDENVYSIFPWNAQSFFVNTTYSAIYAVVLTALTVLLFIFANVLKRKKDRSGVCTFRFTWVEGVFLAMCACLTGTFAWLGLPGEEAGGVAQTVRGGLAVLVAVVFTGLVYLLLDGKWRRFRKSTYHV